MDHRRWQRRSLFLALFTMAPPVVISCDTSGGGGNALIDASVDAGGDSALIDASLDGGGADAASADATSEDAGDGGPTARGFRIQSPDFSLSGNEARTYCYYFRTPNSEALAVNKWKSVMGSAIQEMFVFTTVTDIKPPGTLSSDDCGLPLLGQPKVPVWTYRATTSSAEVNLPSDDGAGKPLAQVIPPNTPGFVIMHADNATANSVTVNARLDAEALAASVPYTQTVAYLAYNAGLAIKPQLPQDEPTEANGGIAVKTCNTPPGAKFWMLSTHTHRLATKTRILNGGPASASVAFADDGWPHLVAKTWSTPFYAFDDATSPNKLTYACTYVNSTNGTITTGDSFLSNEQCVVIGYMFYPPPNATIPEPKACLCAQQGCLALQ